MTAAPAANENAGVRKNARALRTLERRYARIRADLADALGASAPHDSHDTIGERFDAELAERDVRIRDIAALQGEWEGKVEALATARTRVERLRK